MKTAVEWLFLMMYNPNYSEEANQKLLHKAKELEKQQIIEAVENGGIMIGGEEYYNETFNKENNEDKD